MSLPDTRRDLEALGYRYSGESNCRGCGAVILWFDTLKTNPTTGKLNKMPMSIVAGTEDREDRRLEAHWQVCPRRDDFRKIKSKKEKKPRAKKSDDPGTSPRTSDLDFSVQSEVRPGHPPADIGTVETQGTSVGLDSNAGDAPPRGNKTFRIDDFQPCSALVKGYELQPGKHYLIFADAKGFRQDTVERLLHGLREDGANFSVHVVATPKVSKIKVLAKKSDDVSAGNEKKESEQSGEVGDASQLGDFPVRGQSVDDQPDERDQQAEEDNH